MSHVTFHGPENIVCYKYLIYNNLSSKYLAHFVLFSAGINVATLMLWGYEGAFLIAAINIMFGPD